MSGIETMTYRLNRSKLECFNCGYRIDTFSMEAGRCLICNAAVTPEVRVAFVICCELENGFSETWKRKPDLTRYYRWHWRESQSLPAHVRGKARGA